MTVAADICDEPPRALIVEDDPFLLLDLEDMLGAAGINVTGVAFTKSAALDLIHSTPFDVATIDYDLAGETSEDIARLLKKKDIPFILVSGKINMVGNKDVFRGQPALEKPVCEQSLTQTRLHI
jgi:CheY-like chemotaxis protein